MKIFNEQILIVLLGLFLLGVLGYICIYHLNHKVRIQDDINTRTNTTLSEQGLDNVTTSTDGRDIILTGEVASVSIRQQAEDYARKVFGVRTVENKLTVAATGPVVESEPESEALEPVKKEVLQAPKLEPLPEFTCQQDFDALLSSNEINFTNNSADIDASSNNLLSDLIEVANQCLEAKIEITGHTDSHGSDDYNLSISQARASSIKNYLANNGVDATRLFAVAYGETKPIADNESDKGMAKNTKIEFNAEGL